MQTCERAEYTPVLVLGGGLAGMYAAIAAQERGAAVRLLSKKKAGGSGSSVVSMSVHRFAPDAPGLREEYRGRFLRSGAGEQDPALAAFFVDHAAGAMERLKAYGFPLHYRCLEEDGRQFPYLACCDPKRGAILTSAVREYMDRHTCAVIEDGVTACDIVTRGGEAAGVLAERDGRLVFYPAGAVVLATGGAGNIFAATSNTSDVTGDGYAMAARCGLPLVGMEFIQFYPYRICSPRQADIFPDVFEHGAVFRNERGERFMERPCYPRRELENRDVVALAMYREKEVRLDLSGCEQEFLRRECPNIATMYAEDPARPLLLRPVAHFFMGGVPLKTDCTTAVKGLYVCGEVTGGLHGANRLAGSALTETVVFGRIAGEGAAGYAAPEDRRGAPELDACLARYPEQGADGLGDLKTRLREAMWEGAAVVRTEAGLQKALSALDGIQADFARRQPADLREWIELRDLLFTARAVASAALRRKNSLGPHVRADTENAGKND